MTRILVLLACLLIGACSEGTAPGEDARAGSDEAALDASARAGAGSEAPSATPQGRAGLDAPAAGNARPDDASPNWAADVIWYQIFPERFANGDPSNDPTISSLPLAAVVPDSWTTSEWGSDWYEREPWEVEMGGGHYDTVRLRRYGGDLQGIYDRLDYIRTLGVTGLYFNPLFWARSEHKYDGNTYHHIDPYFGPDPEGDFRLMATESSDPATWTVTAADSLFFAVVDRAHSLGLRVIIDGVFNHTGKDFFAFQDIAENQEASPYTEWYKVTRFDDPATPENEFDYEGWWGSKYLPEFADTPDGTNLHPGPKAYVFDATRRWMDPNGDGDTSDGVDGWRLDVVPDVPTGFWAEWNAYVRSIRPDAYTVAEIWTDAAESLAAGGFSATMNYYGFAFPIKGFLIDGRMTAGDFVATLAERRAAYSPETARLMQNLIDSHDTERVVSMISNASRDRPYQREDWEIWWDYDWGGAAGPPGDPGYLIGAPNAEDRAIQRLIGLFQMTYVGAPMVYYGTEAGMWAGDDPDDRQPMWWPDITYEEQAGDPRGIERAASPVEFDLATYEFYRDVIGLRRSHDAFVGGTFEPVLTDDNAQVVAYARALEEEYLLVILNRSPNSQEIRLHRTELELGVGEGLYPVFNTAGASQEVRPFVAEDGALKVTLPALSGAVWIRTGVE